MKRPDLTPDHTIVIDPQAPAAVRTAAHELQRHLLQIAGLDLRVVETAAAVNGPEILIGDGARLRAVAPDIDVRAMRDEEYLLRVSGSSLIVAGGSPRGTLHGVYGYLRDHLGCRWFTPDCAVVPKRDRIPLNPLEERSAPAFEYRNFILSGVDDPAWCARNGYNGINSPDDSAYGGHMPHWHYGHSLHALCPAETYFAEHPEYFDSQSRRKKVVDDYINLCYTHDEVVRIVTANMRQAMAQAVEKQRQDPAVSQPTVFYLAQNDGGTPCACPGCRTIADDQGSLSAPLIHFCNRVVEALGDEFPHFRMMTIAYRFSRKPPRTLRPHPKLIVQLCTIECCQAHPYSSCDDPDDILFRQDLEGWRALTDNLWVWDYMPRLWHPFLTGPGFDAMAANYRWFHDHGVRGMFTQTGGERDFKWLNAYLMCQMMRDPAQDWTALQNEFMDAYYGPAAAPLSEFLGLVQESVVTGNHHLHYKEGTVKPFFSESVISRGDQLFAEANDCVRDDPERSARVREEHMHFLCTKLQHACRNSVLNACRIADNRYVFERPEAMRREVETFSAWKAERFGQAGTQSYTRTRGGSCMMWVESDLVTLDNGTLDLEFLPRLAGRMVGLRHKPTGRNLLAMAACEGGCFSLENGYREEWLAAPDAYEQESSSGWSHRQGVTTGSAEASNSACVAGDVTACGQVFETGGKFMHPLQWERWTRLDATGGGFHIESMIVNRGAVPIQAPVETILPLDLGLLHDIVAAGHALADCTGPLSFSPEEAAAGLLLENHKAGLALKWRATGEIIESVLLQPEADRLTIRIRTRGETLTPGAGRRFCQFFAVDTPE